MKHFTNLLKSINKYFIVFILIQNILTAPETDFAIYPEDITETQTTSFFTIIPTTEKIIGAYFFGNDSTTVKDARSGLIFKNLNNKCIIPVKDDYNSATGAAATNIDGYELKYNQDKSTTFSTANFNYNLSTKLLTSKDTISGEKAGLICDFDITGSILTSTNTLKLYMFMGKGGTGHKALFSSDIDDATKIDFIKRLSSYVNTNEITGLDFTGGDFSVQTISISKGSTSSDSTKKAKIRINAGAEQDDKYTNNANVYMRIMQAGDEEIFLGPFVATIVASDSTNNHINGSSCVDNTNCVGGFYCATASPANTCTGKCHPTCLRCTGNLKANCETCSPLSSRALDGVDPSTYCGGLDYLPYSKLNQDVSFNLNSSSYSNAATISFWIFIESTSTILDNLINVIISDKLMLSLGSEGTPNHYISGFCTSGLEYYTTLSTITSKAALEIQLLDTEKNIKKTSFTASVNKNWFHVKCSYSNDVKKQYIAMHTKNLADVKINADETIKNHNYIKTFEIDFPFRFFTAGPTVKIKYNSNLTSTNILIKNLVIFSDYIPRTINYEYTNVSNLKSTYNFPSLWLFADLNDIDINETISGSNRSSSTTYYKCTISTCSSSTTSFNLSATNLITIPDGYYRLNISPINKFYSEKDLITQADLTCTSPRKQCFKNDKAVSCIVGNFWKTDFTCNSTCDANLMVTYVTGTTNTQSGGYCTVPCGTGKDCNTNFSTFNSNSTCPANYTKLYLYCYLTTDEKKGAYFNSGLFKQPTISHTLTTALNNYTVEIWYYPDRRFAPATSNSFVFLMINDASSNGLNIVKAGSNAATTNDYQLKIGSTQAGSNFSFLYENWYRLAFTVSYSSGTYTYSFHYNKYQASFQGLTTTSNISLKTVQFNSNFFSGFYRYLKIWDGSFISTDLYKEMDKIFVYSDMFKLTPFKSNLRFYPMVLKYLGDGTMRDYITDTDTTITSTGITLDIYQKLNFSVNFDKTSDLKYISAITEDIGNITITESNCPTNCKTCNSLECTSCNDGFILITGACTDPTGSYYYFLSPALDSTTKAERDLTFTAITLTTKVTISFFIKFYANRLSTTIDIFRYTSGLKIRLDFSNPTVNLELYSAAGVIGTYSNFLSRFGKWTHISLAYYYDAAKAAYFPSMLNFQVNFEGVTTTASRYSALSITSLVMEIPKESIALYAKIYVWDFYYTGSWAYQSFTPYVLAPVKKIDLETTSTCLTQTGYDLYCFKDNSPYLIDTNYCTTDRAHYNGSTCLTKIAACPYGFYTADASSIYCSCDNKVDDMWINVSDTRHYCKKLEFINWLKYVPIVIPSLASATTEYTVEFWIYINLYTPSAFDGIDIIWEKHLKISLSYNSSFKSTCYPVFYTSDPTTSALNTSTINFSANGNPWGYIRCSVDLASKLYFHFDETLITTEQNLISSSSTVASSPSANLTIKGTTDSNKLTNQGVVFIKQLRLWNCYLCQDADTYRKEITTITASKYTNLFYLYESPYISPEVITEIKSSTNPTITLNTSWIGYNVFDMTNYSKLSSVSTNNGNSYLCNELKDVCSGLLKLNQIDNLTFTGISPPMNGRYTLEFWFMSTSATNLSSGIHFIWRNSVSVSLIRDVTTNTNINAYCWPQDHKLNLQNTTGDVNINNLSTTTLNYDLLQTANASSTWIWIRCAVNYTNRNFYFSNNITKSLLGETVYGTVRNDVPFRYLWQNNELSNLYIFNAAQNSSANVFIRSVNLFNDFLPKGYLFKDSDISKVDSTKMPFMVMSINMGGYYKQLNKMGHFIGSTWSYKKPTAYNSMTLTYDSSLVVKRECSSVLNLKYNSVTDLCEAITNCTLASLNAKYCSSENTAVVCADNYFYDPTTFTCSSTCSNSYYRGPGSSTVSSICNTLCDTNSAKCSGMTSAQLTTLNTSYTCQPGFDRVGYNCIDQTKSAKCKKVF